MSFLKSFIWKLKTQESYAIVFSELLVLWTKKKKKLRWMVRGTYNYSAVFWVIIVHFSHGLRDILIGIRVRGKTRDNKN